jgi:DNA primase
MNNFSSVERNKIFSLSQESLHEESEGALACRDYLKSRGISRQCAYDFCLGYVPERVGHYLSDRLILPLKYANGDLAYLTSRKFRDASLNRGHWHESFDKSLFLFSHPNSFITSFQKKYSIVVEGQFDCMSISSIGFQNTYSILGSNFSRKQLLLLFGVSKNIILFFDNDEAGEAATRKVFDIFFKEKMFKKGYSLAKWPKYSEKDPDDLCRSRGIENSIKYINGIVDRILGEINVRRNNEAGIFDF